MSKSKTNADDKLYSELEDLFNRLSSQSDNDALNDKHIFDKTNELVQCLKKLERKAFYEKILFRLGCLLLVVGLGILFWGSIRIYVIYLIRFAFVYVSNDLFIFNKTKKSLNKTVVLNQHCFISLFLIIFFRKS